MGINRLTRQLPVLASLTVVAASILLGGAARVANGQDVDCDDGLERAQTMYFEGRFDETLSLLQTCLRQGAFPEDEQQKEVYLLIGRTNYAKGLEDEAKNALRALLSIVPSYRADPAQFPPSFVQLVEDVRQEMAAEAPVAQPEPTVQETDKGGGATKWLLIGGGAVAAGVVGAVLAAGGGNGGGNGGNGNGGPSILSAPPALP